MMKTVKTMMKTLHGTCICNDDEKKIHTCIMKREIHKEMKKQMIEIL